MPISEDIEVGSTVHFDKHRCPACDVIIDAATSCTGDHVPSEGDITICLMCGHLMAFADDKGAVRNLTDEEMYEAAGHPTILLVQKARRIALEKRLAADSFNRSNNTDSSRSSDKE